MFFLFQAEDGIRDYKVTGVQTCALPISTRSPAPPLTTSSMATRMAAPRVARPGRRAAAEPIPIRPATTRTPVVAAGRTAARRSEEGRGGEEGRSRGAPYH